MAARPGLGDAGVGRAEVETVTAALDLDRVEELAAERLDADDRAAARRDVFLHEQDLVDRLRDRAVGDRSAQLLARGIADDARAGAADVRLDQQRISNAFGGREQVARAVDDAGLRDCAGRAT